MPYGYSLFLLWERQSSLYAPAFPSWERLQLFYRLLRSKLFSRGLWLSFSAAVDTYLGCLGAFTGQSPGSFSPSAFLSGCYLALLAAWERAWDSFLLCAELSKLPWAGLIGDWNHAKHIYKIRKARNLQHLSIMR